MTRKALLTLIVPLLLAACGTAGVASTQGSPAPSASVPSTAYPTPAATAAPTPAPTPVPTATPQVQPSVFVAQNMNLGAILVNGQGRTLYYFVPERGSRIVCIGQCTGAWPPAYTASMSPTANVALPGQLEAIARPGGEQVTYNRWPLYTFAGDNAADQTNGQGIFGFGGKWFVATPGLQP